MSRRRKIFHGSPRNRARTRFIHRLPYPRMQGNKNSREENNRVRFSSMRTIVECVAEASKLLHQSMRLIKSRRRIRIDRMNKLFSRSNILHDIPRDAATNKIPDRTRLGS